MAKWMYLNEAVRQGKVELGSYVDCPSDYSEIVIERAKADTFWKKQFAKTEKLNWTLFSDQNGKIGLVSDRLTKFELHLGGREGFIHAPGILDKYGKLYNCKKLGVQGVGMTESIFMCLTDKQKFIKGKYWLKDQSEPSLEPLRELKLAYIKNGEVKYCMLAGSDGSRNVESYEIRPVRILNPKTKVKVNDSLHDGSFPFRMLQIKLSLIDKIFGYFI